MMEQVTRWVREDPAGLGRPQLSGAEEVNSMAVPMMLLCLIDQLGEGDPEMCQKYQELGAWSVQRILQHLQVRQLQNGTGRGHSSHPDNAGSVKHLSN